MMTLPGEFSPERVGHGEVGGFTQRVKTVPAKPWTACGAHPLGAERATCRVFSMNELMQETVLSPCSASKLHQCSRLLFVPERIDLVRVKTR